ncbi:hypothetical protein AKJ64_00035 [candidate division MSBL1 archaeon SCGC-AAA259E17]|uniref:Uncharacterized protein n=1 Tax=candidate division MSBL1 archaeon SCGC-AAA259E17 TaxID=1698263 RepID=A0A133UHF5_9EURY|nr:hypothetical protein AKJ64_00035 [candidate division MSBL1 archaeon SCGC-AAA259E17]
MARTVSHFSRDFFLAYTYSWSKPKMKGEVEDFENIHDCEPCKKNSGVKKKAVKTVKMNGREQ